MNKKIQIPMWVRQLGQKSSNGYGLLSGFDSVAHLIRFCLGLAVIGIVAYILVVKILSAISTQPGVKIEATGNAIVFTVKAPDEDSRTAIVLVPANQLWVDTGIKIHEDEVVEITATGSVNLSIHRTVEAANNDTRPRLRWVGPEGAEKDPELKLDQIRNPLRVMNTTGYGCLLGYLRPSLLAPQPNKFNPKPANLFKIGEGKKLKGKRGLYS